jgi:predicted nucleotidyltransferase
MVVVAETLFGSRARGDNSEYSDVDLLHVTNEDRVFHSQVAGVSVSSYPLADLKQKAATGDLFLYHVLFEGRPLYDPGGYLEVLKSSFVLRSDYSVEIRRAVDLGWFIIHYRNSISDQDMIGRRVAWVVRTILIAKSAEAGRPIFSRSALANTLPGLDVESLIAAKHSTMLRDQTLSKLQAFLDLFSEPSSTRAQSLGWYIDRFKRSQNLVALRLLAVKEPSVSTGYS